MDTQGETVTGDFGTSIAFDGEVGWGFFGSYNFSNRLAVSGDWTFVNPDYTATYLVDNPIGPDTTATLRHEADINNIHIKGTFHFLEGDFTPFVEAGLGWTWIDSNVADGPPTTGCWWDPWWGYICTNFYETYDSTQTSYTYSAGVRWDLSTSFMVRAEYGILSIDTSAASGSADTEALRIAFGWRF
jgi:opacity protein-like surface antigen